MNGPAVGAGELALDLPALADPLALGCALLREDRLAASLSTREVRALTDAALIDGAALADEVTQRWGSDPDAIAAANSIPVEDVQTDGGYGTTVVFAQYRTRPLGIVLHCPAIAALDRRLRACGLTERFGGDGTRSVFLAHELYHHFDEGRAAPLCSRHRVPVLRLGPLRVSAPLPGLREIAAGAFAQRLLRLPLHPRALDIVLARTLHMAPTTPPASRAPLLGQEGRATAFLPASHEAGWRAVRAPGRCGVRAPRSG